MKTHQKKESKPAFMVIVDLGEGVKYMYEK